MRFLTTIALVLVAPFAVAAEASAETRLVAPVEAVGNPAFAGDDVVFFTHPSERTIELRRVTPGSESTTLRAFPIAAEVDNPMSDGFDDYRVVDAEVAGSPIHIAASAWGFTVSRYSDVFAEVRGAVVGMPAAHADLARGCPRIAEGDHVDIDGTRLAFVGGDCNVHVRDLVSDSDVTAGPWSWGPVSLAGRFVVYRMKQGGLEVFDTEAAAVAYRAAADRRVDSFAVQSDGKVAAGFGADSRCRELAWFSVGEPREHRITKCDGGPVSGIEGNRIVHGTPRGLAVSDLAGTSRLLALPQPAAPRALVGFDSGRVVYSTRGCSPDTGAIYSVGIDDPAVTPVAQSLCRPRIGGGTLKASRKDVVSVRISCPEGCRGAVRVDRRVRRGKYEEASSPTAFLIPRGGVKRLPVSLDAYSFGRRGRKHAARVLVDVIRPTGLARSYTRSVTLRR